MIFYLRSTLYVTLPMCWKSWFAILEFLSLKSDSDLSTRSDLCFFSNVNPSTEYSKTYHFILHLPYTHSKHPKARISIFSAVRSRSSPQMFIIFPSAFSCHQPDLFCRTSNLFSDIDSSLVRKYIHNSIFEFHRKPENGVVFIFCDQCFQN